MSVVSISKEEAVLRQLWEKRSRSSTFVGSTQMRDEATRLVRAGRLPTTRDEDWCFTDLSPLLEVTFQTLEAPFEIPPERTLNLPVAEGDRLVFVNGRFAPHLSAAKNLPKGAIAGNLLSASSEIAAVAAQYAGNQPDGSEIFTALNSACFEDAAVVFLPRNAIAETPIYLTFVTVPQAEPIATYPRAIVVLERGSACTLVEEYLAIGAGNVYLSDAVTEIWLGDNASLRHGRVQQESDTAFHIGKTAISQGRDSACTSTAIGAGARLSRHNLRVEQTGEGTQTNLYGLTAIADEQLGDTYGTIALNHPNGSAHQLHKCIADGSARSVFAGRIVVPQPAQMTDASQLNRNLLLSRQAKADTRPQLEIVADNVKCSHGATVSQLEEDELFYLQSRGLAPALARNLLVDGFAAEICQQLPVPALRDRLARFLADRLER